MLDLAAALARNALLGCVVAAVLAFSAGAQNGAAVSVGPDNVAIKGYDPVAYFTEDRAVRGSSDFEHLWNDARWRFSSAEHRDLFAADPERYSPQFGGFCAWAMSQDMVVEADPEAWTIVDGRLYLKMNHSARDEWRKAPGANIAKAFDNWASLQQGG